MAYDLNNMPSIAAYDPTDPSISAIISPVSIDAPKEHRRPDWLRDSMVKSPEKGDPYPFALAPEDLKVFHLSPVEDYVLPEEQLRPIDVICIGAGMAGMTASIVAQWRLKRVNLKVVEKNATFSGTWAENRYPGCKVDVPSHYYSWRFEPNDWASGYPSSCEVYDYFAKVYWLYGVDQFVRFNIKVTQLRYDDASALWEVHMQNTKTGESWIELAHVVINGQGFLNRPKYPDDVPGFETFKGKVLHTARWDNTYSCVGKEVALIGTGSSGLQVAGAIGPFTKKLVIFMRTPCWTMPFFQNLILTPEERENFKDRKFFFDYYKKSWETAERFFQVYFDGSAMQKRVMAMATEKLEREVKDPELRKRLTPNFPFGCRRLTPSLNFLDVVQMSHVTLVSGPVLSHVVPEGIVTKDGTLHKVECIVVATGFNTTYYNEEMPIYGRGGRSLKDDWTPHAWAHNSMTVTGYPGLFYCMGPLAPVAANSIHIQEEQQINYTFKAIKFMQQSIKPVRSYDPHKEPIMKFLDETQKFLKSKSVWRYNCGGWYADKNGFILQWPGPSNTYMDAIAAPDWSQYDVAYWNSEEEMQTAQKKKWEEIKARNEAAKKGARL